MKIEVRFEPDVAILQPDGKLDYTDRAELAAILQDICERQIKHVLIDFACIDYLNSSGLRVLIDIMKQVNAEEGATYFCSVNSNLRDLFKIVILDGTIPMFPNVEVAIERLTQA